ncbi:MAG: phosphoadenylyl-sulfate reductase [Candidatus Binatia bacterium]
MRAPHPEPALDLDTVNRELAGATPEAILAWTCERFRPHVILSCSFQHDGVALAHMLTQIDPSVPIVFINTGFHFPETLAYRDTLVARCKFNLVELHPIMPRAEFAERHGLDLYARDPDLCCHINKVEPLKRYLPGVRAWINGRRRDQAITRQDTAVVEEYQGGLYKINPIAAWSSRDTFYYLDRHGIPTHPLFDKGYASIGCAPCTRPVLPGEDERAGRWAGTNKTECGIHTFLDRKA